MKNSRKIAFTTALVAAVATSSYFVMTKDNRLIDPAPVVQKTSRTFLFLSDIHLDSHTQFTNYGSDTGMLLWKAFLSKADSVITETKPDFILYTGDLPSHVSFCCAPLSASERISHNENIDTILTGLRDLATRHQKALMYLPGNNDGIAGDYASFADEKKQTPFSLIPENHNPYPAVNMDTTGTTIPYLASNPDPKKGYYSAIPIKGLRVIALNTVIHSANFFSADSSNQLVDAQKQMSWLSNQLLDAKNKSEKVYVAMHIPPGIDAYGFQKHGNKATNWEELTAPNDWNNQFLQLLSDHQETISGILYGHTHMDELRRFYDPKGEKITEIGISCPGVTPNHNNNPGFKVVTYDSDNKEFLDFTTYYTVPTATTWGTASYNFNHQFKYTNGKTLYENLTNDSIDSIHAKLNTIYTVMNGSPSYNIAPGIEVKTEN